jgi:hypothetical protein
MFAVFDWKMDEKVNSTSLVFDLLGGNACLQGKRDLWNFVHPRLDDPEEAVGLVSGEEGQAGSGG